MGGPPPGNPLSALQTFKVHIHICSIVWYAPLVLLDKVFCIWAMILDPFGKQEWIIFGAIFEDAVK